MSSDNAVLVLIELDEAGNILPISLESLNVGKVLADKYKGKLIALVMGSDISRVSEEVCYYGVNIVYSADHSMLKDYQPDCYVSAFLQVYKNISPKAIVMGDTLQSIDLAPRIAFRLNTGLISDCVKVDFDSDETLFIKPVYSGNVMAVYTQNAEPYMLTMRSRSVDAIDKKEKPSGEIIPVEVEIDPSIIKVKTINRVTREGDGEKLQDADVIVSGGRGIGGPDGFHMLAELVNLLGGALGASRPPCDLNWISSTAQVGQTGVIVGPSLYIAIGISGSTQHLVGIIPAKTIVAINKDRNANIFTIADYGVVGNYEEVIPSFIGRIKEIVK